jgi:hypothetical protein
LGENFATALLELQVQALRGREAERNIAEMKRRMSKKLFIFHLRC